MSIYLNISWLSLNDLNNSRNNQFIKGSISQYHHFPISNIYRQHNWIFLNSFEEMSKTPYRNWQSQSKKSLFLFLTLPVAFPNSKLLLKDDIQFYQTKKTGKFHYSEIKVFSTNIMDI